MADYTMRLSDVIRSIYSPSYDKYDFTQEYHSVVFDGVRYGKLPTVTDWSLMGLGTYPIFDENYRDVINGKIVDEYFNREIGAETIDIFILNLRRKMDQIMPFYNQLYQSEKILFDPLATMDIKTEGTAAGTEENTTNGTTTSNSGVTSGARAVSQELPQTMLAGSGDYATSASDTNSKSDTTATSDQSGTGNTTNNSNSTSHTTGFQGVASELLMRYRNSLLNIDVMVLSELPDLFMLIMNHGDSYFQRGWYY